MLWSDNMPVGKIKDSVFCRDLKWNTASGNWQVVTGAPLQPFGIIEDADLNGSLLRIDLDIS